MVDQHSMQRLVRIDLQELGLEPDRRGQLVAGDEL